MKVDIDEKRDYFGGYSADSSIFSMNFDEFVLATGGRLAIALFEGKFKDELWSVLAVAQARGMKIEHDQLVLSVKKK